MPAVATTPGEHFTVIVGMFVGAGTFAYLVGAICGILTQVRTRCRVRHAVQSVSCCACNCDCTRVMRAPHLRLQMDEATLTYNRGLDKLNYFSQVRGPRTA